MQSVERRRSFSFSNLLSRPEVTIGLVTMICAIVFGSLFVNFVTAKSAQVIFIIAGTYAMVGAGETMLLISGELDLSVGTVFAMTPYLMNSFYGLGIPIVIAFLMSLLLAGLVGLANGYLSAKIGVPALITTLGMFFLIRGLTLIISSFHLISLPNIEPFRTLVGSGIVLGVLPIPMVWTVGVVVVVALMLLRTRHGLWTIATGSNPTGAGEVGVNTVRTKIYNFVLTAILAGLAGLIQGMRIGSAEPIAGGFDLTLGSIASSAVGGTSLMGGSGTIIGTLIGALLFGVFRDGLIIGGASEQVYEMVLGTAVVLAVALNAFLLGRRGRSGKQV
jgi:simple sugar transport system permease protein